MFDYRDTLQRYYVRSQCIILQAISCDSMDSLYNVLPKVCYGYIKSGLCSKTLSLPLPRAIIRCINGLQFP